MASASRFPLAVVATLLLTGCPQVQGGASADTTQLDDAGADIAGPADAVDGGPKAGDVAAPAGVTAWLQGDWLVATAGHCEVEAHWQQVKWVADGDTIYLVSDAKVRFLMIDTPELSSDDCEAKAALAFTEAELKETGRVCLEADAVAGDKDMYGRLLRYVWYRREGKVVQLNARLVREGHARIFYPYAKDLKYEGPGLAMQKQAKAEKLGGWGACGW